LGRLSGVHRPSRELDPPFHEATIETNSHHISLVFADLLVDELTRGYARSYSPTDLMS
jgi:hypothetical protein